MTGASAAAGPARTVPVSVVIPFYGGHQTIQRAVDSVNAQELPPSEIVVVDDASPAPFPAETIRSEIPLRVVLHDRNRGIPAARNSGLRGAAHEWLAFLDQDDEWAPDKLARQWRLVEESAAAGEGEVVIFGRLLMESGEGQPYLLPPRRAIAAVEEGGECAVRAFIRHGNIVPIITLLLPRSLFGRYGALDASLRGGADDAELVLRLLAEGVRFRFDDDPGAGRWSAAHRFTGRNYSAHAPRWIADQLDFFPRLAERYPLLAPLGDHLLASARFRLGRHYDRLGEMEAATIEYRRAIRLRPFWLRPWVARARLAAPAPVRRLTASAWRRVRDRIRGIG